MNPIKGIKKRRLSAVVSDFKIALVFHNYSHGFGNRHRSRSGQSKNNSKNARGEDIPALSDLEFASECIRIAVLQ
jgi:hypothetical protein